VGGADDVGELLSKWGGACAWNTDEEFFNVEISLFMLVLKGSIVLGLKVVFMSVLKAVLLLRGPVFMGERSTFLLASNAVNGSSTFPSAPENAAEETTVVFPATAKGSGSSSHENLSSSLMVTSLKGSTTPKGSGVKAPISLSLSPKPERANVGAGARGFCSSKPPAAESLLYPKAASLKLLSLPDPKSASLKASEPKPVLSLTPLPLELKPESLKLSAKALAPLKLSSPNALLLNALVSAEVLENASYFTSLAVTAETLPSELGVKGELSNADEKDEPNPLAVESLAGVVSTPDEPKSSSQGEAAGKLLVLLDVDSALVLGVVKRSLVGVGAEGAGSGQGLLKGVSKEVGKGEWDGPAASNWAQREAGN